MKSLAALLLVAACTDPVVDMQLVMPKNADSFDTSCITAVEVRVTGEHYLQDPTDVKRQCIEISGGTSYAAIRDAIRGKFELAIPDSGLAGVEIYGLSGPSACKEPASQFASPDLLFYGRGDYIGQDRLDIPLIPNLSCTRSTVNVRIVDMMALIGGATCTTAANIGTTGWASIGTLAPRLWGKGSEFHGGLDWANANGNLATFQGASKTGTLSCPVIDGGSEAGGSTGCAVTGGASVCAAAGEIEHPLIPTAILANTANYDATLMTKFPGVVIGSVWANGTTKTPLAGAQVSLDAAHGKVIYLDPPNAAGAMTPRASQDATGPSGLFALYTDTVASVKVSANNLSRTVLLGAADETYAGAMIVLGP
jgi:hypothetical protein